jgi:hypothetical protein
MVPHDPRGRERNALRPAPSAGSVGSPAARGRRCSFGPWFRFFGSRWRSTDIGRSGGGRRQRSPPPPPLRPRVDRFTTARVALIPQVAPQLGEIAGARSPPLFQVRPVGLQARGQHQRLGGAKHPAPPESARCQPLCWGLSTGIEHWSPRAARSRRCHWGWGGLEGQPLGA